MVSVGIVAYNHGEYIAEAIESVLMQKTNFNIELVIGEDCSSDNTRSVIKEYQKKYPDIIKPVFQEKNVGMHANVRATLANCTGKYFASFDGDDFWTDEHKLQKQVDFLETHPELSACAHNVDVLDNRSKEKSPSMLNVQALKRVNINQTGFDTICHTCSVVYRGNFNVLPNWYDLSPAGEWPFFSYILSFGDIVILPETMAVYRQNVGQWSTLSRLKQLRNICESIDVLLNAPEFVSFTQFRRNLTQTKINYIKEISSSQQEMYKDEMAIINYYEKALMDINTAFADEKELSEKVKAKTLLQALLSKFLSK